MPLGQQNMSNFTPISRPGPAWYVASIVALGALVARPLVLTCTNQCRYQEIRGDPSVLMDPEPQSYAARLLRRPLDILNGPSLDVTSVP